MRKIVQKQIMDMIPAIWDGVQYIQTAELENALPVLQDCLLAMKTLRESLRSGLSETRFAYYQHFYDQAFLSLGNIEKGLKVVDQISEIYTGLDTILTDITEEKEVKLEILFLPYKASMWDSLESIWLAAKDDSKCDAYVMPIPYCDRNPDGSAAAWHCEADLFPEYVPVTDFHQYNIVKRKPDVVYIHNPYDEYNRVTSVDPKYYSSELKKHTDMLVYVPYFVSGDKIEPHFCQVAAVINADKVIVESEEIKKQYELAYPGGNPPENKFLALGSPKFDKVLHSSRADFILPKRWKELMHGKKVILYNTSLAAMLENPNEANKKLKYVLSIFKNRKDIVLWWRPHPLIKATMQSMHPEIFREYENIEQEYKLVSWGIYDDSADLHRAISWSDAYYGDESSIVWMYKITGKPIMIQNMEMIEQRINAMYFEYMAVEGRNVWFISARGAFTGLFKMDIDTDETECFGELPVRYQRQMEYVVLEKVGNKIVMAPYFSNDGFIEYDILSKNFTRIPLKKTFMNTNISEISSFGNAVLNKKSIFFVGNANGLIVEYNALKKEYIYHTQWARTLSHEIETEQLIFFRHGYVQENNIIYLIAVNTDKIIEFDLYTCESKLHSIPFEFKAANISYDGTYFWIMPYNGNIIVKWNRETDVFLKIILPINENIDMPFWNGITLNNREVLLPCTETAVFTIQMRGDKIDRWEELENNIVQASDNQNRDTEKYSFVLSGKKGDQSFALKKKKRSLQEFDCLTGAVREHLQHLIHDDVKQSYLKSKSYQLGALINEGDCLTLMDLLDSRLEKRVFKKKRELAGLRIKCYINKL